MRVRSLLLRERRTVIVSSREATGYVDVDSVLVVYDASHIAHGRVDQQLLLLAELAPLLALRVGQRARVAEARDRPDREVADARDVHRRAAPQVRAAQVAVYGDRPVALALGRAHFFSRGEVLDAVREHVRVGVAEYEGAELHDADEAGEVQDLRVGVSPVQDTREVEEFRSLVYFGPEPLLECLFGIFENGGFFDEVEVGEDADNLGEPMGLQDVQEFEGFLWSDEKGKSKEL